MSRCHNDEVAAYIDQDALQEDLGSPFNSLDSETVEIEPVNEIAVEATPSELDPGKGPDGGEPHDGEPLNDAPDEDGPDDEHSNDSQLDGPTSSVDGLDAEDSVSRGGEDDDSGSSSEEWPSEHLVSQEMMEAGNLKHALCPKCSPSRPRSQKEAIFPEERHVSVVEYRAPFLFLRLPGEIRNRIYTFLLYCQRFTIVNHGNMLLGWHMRKRVASRPHRTRFHTARELDETYVLGQARADTQLQKAQVKVLRVNKQVYDEALYIFYSINQFDFYDIETLVPFCCDISSKARKCLRSVMLCYQNPLSWAHVEYHDEWDKTDLDEFHLGAWWDACCYLSEETKITDLVVQLLYIRTDYDSMREADWEEELISGDGPYRTWMSGLANIKTVKRFALTDFLKDEHLDIMIGRHLKKQMESPEAT
ncbi:MAG: hypothetical protein M1838_004634 [Thelocarpon superellum]|nr:MAG: hypothetical protein M1838_004634 [Thelocarpon superellum]